MSRLPKETIATSWFGSATGCQNGVLARETHLYRQTMVISPRTRPIGSSASHGSHPIHVLYAAGHNETSSDDKLSAERIFGRPRLGPAVRSGVLRWILHRTPEGMRL